MASLKKAVEQYTNIDMFEDIIISRLLVENNRVSGAIGLDTKRGTIKAFQCKALVLAADNPKDEYAFPRFSFSKLGQMEPAPFSGLFYLTFPKQRGVLPTMNVHGIPNS